MKILSHLILAVQKKPHMSLKIHPIKIEFFDIPLIAILKTFYSTAFTNHFEPYGAVKTINVSFTIFL